jgi:hypothetical protein
VCKPIENPFQLKKEFEFIFSGKREKFLGTINKA